MALCSEELSTITFRRKHLRSAFYFSMASTSVITLLQAKRSSTAKTLDSGQKFRVRAELKSTIHCANWHLQVRTSRDGYKTPQPPKIVPVILGTPGLVLSDPSAL
jgi:hypothetical protein